MGWCITLVFLQLTAQVIDNLFRSKSNADDFHN
jgi:hypothetical protein